MPGEEWPWMKTRSPPCVSLARAPEMHEADIVKRRGGLEAGDMAAEFGGNLVGLEHDGCGVPADRGADFGLDGAHARRLGLVGRRDGVDIGGVPGEGQLRAIFPRFRHHLAQDVVHPLHALKFLNRVQGLEPLAHFERGVVTVHGFLQISRQHLVSAEARDDLGETCLFSIMRNEFTPHGDIRKMN